MRKDVLKVLGVSAEGKENVSGVSQPKPAESSTLWGVWGRMQDAVQGAVEALADKAEQAAEATGILSEDSGAKAKAEVKKQLQKSQEDRLSSREQASVINIFLNNNADDHRNSAYGPFVHLLNEFRKYNDNGAPLKPIILITALKDLKEVTGDLEEEHFIALLKSADPAADAKRIVAEERESRAKSSPFASEDESFGGDSALEQSTKIGAGSVGVPIESEQPEARVHDSAIDKEVEVTEFPETEQPPIVVEGIALESALNDMQQEIESADAESSFDDLDKQVKSLEAKLVEWEENLQKIQDEYPDAMTTENVQIFNQMNLVLREQLDLLKSTLEDKKNEFEVSEGIDVGELPPIEDSEEEMGRNSSDVRDLPPIEESEEGMDRASSDVGELPPIEDSEEEMGRTSSDVGDLPPIEDSEEGMDRTSSDVGDLPLIEESEEGMESFFEEPLESPDEAFEKKVAAVRDSLNKNPLLKNEDKKRLDRVLKTLFKPEQLGQLERLEKRIDQQQQKGLQDFVESLQKEMRDVGLESDSRRSMSKRVGVINLNSSYAVAEKYERLLEVKEEIDQRIKDLAQVDRMRELIRELPGKSAEPFLNRLNEVEKEIKNGEDTAVKLTLAGILIDVENGNHLFEFKRSLTSFARDLGDPEKTQALKMLEKVEVVNERHEDVEVALKALVDIKKRVSDAQSKLQQQVKGGRQEGMAAEAMQDNPREDIKILLVNNDSEKARIAKEKLGEAKDSDDLSTLRNELAAEVLNKVNIVDRAVNLKDRVAKVNIKKNYEYDMDYINKELGDLKAKISVLEKIYPDNPKLQQAKLQIVAIEQKISENEEQKNKSIFTKMSEKILGSVRPGPKEEVKMSGADVQNPSSKPARSPRLPGPFGKKARTAESTASAQDATPVSWAKPAEKKGATPGAGQSTGKTNK